MPSLRSLSLPAVAAAAYLLGRRSAARPARPAAPATGPSRPRPDQPSPGPVPVPGGPPPEAVRPDLPGVDAEIPTEIPAAGWRQIIRRALRETKDDDLALVAAGVAFWAFVGLFPALIAAVTLYGLIADPAEVQEQVRDLSDALPPESARLISDQLTEIAGGSRGALGLGLVVSLGAALFSASGAVANLIKAINLAYDEQETRNIVRLRGLALLMTLGAVLFVTVAVGIIAVLPAVLDTLGLGAGGRLAADVLRWVGLVLFVGASLAVVYRYAPDRDNPRLSWVSLGAGVATVLWVLGSVGFSVYVGTFGNYSETYGALAGVIVLLLWLFLTAFVVLFGAEVNSETEHQTAEDSTVGPPRPMGRRNAVKADTLPPQP